MDCLKVLQLTIVYRRLLKSEFTFTNDELLALLRVANKYCMESTEEEIVSHFQTPDDKEGFMKLFEASRIVGSKPLQDKAIQGLLPYKEGITLEEASRIGMEAFYKIMTSPQIQRGFGGAFGPPLPYTGPSAPVSILKVRHR